MSLKLAECIKSYMWFFSEKLSSAEHKRDRPTSHWVTNRSIVWEYAPPPPPPRIKRLSQYDSIINPGFGLEVATKNARGCFP